MSDVDEILPPKNYINLSINKKLLTPCRRVGLSRTRKTPEISHSPNHLISPVTITRRSNITNRIDSENSPKRCLISQPEKYSDQVTPDKNIIESNYQATDSYTTAFKTPLRDTFPNCRRIGLSRSKTTPKDIKRSNLQNQMVGNIEGIPSTVTKNAKRCLNPRLDEANLKTERNIGEKNSLEHQQNTNALISSAEENQGVIQSCVISKETKDELPYNFLPGLDLNTNVLTSHCPVDIEPDSPPKSPVFSEVSVLVHHPAAKKSMNSTEADKLQNQAREVTKKDQQLSEILEESDVIVKSEKLKLDRIDFEKNENINTTTAKNNIHVKAKVNCSSVNKSCPKKSNKTSKFARFSTEDYLEEYSKNPHTFEDSSEIDETKNISTDIDSSSTDDFQPLEILRTKKINTKSCTGRRESKNYLAILCPPTENSGIGDSTGALSEPLFKLKGASPKHLTVSLERLSNICIKDNGKTSGANEDDHLFKKRKNIVSKLTFQTDDSDDEMFTSSPESNRKQRENLMQLISSMKKEVKQKEETLERLKQAQAYKKMHSTEDLNKLTNRWIQGCKIALEDLLMKLMEHGPMEMDILLKNLRIPDDIVNKLKLL